MGTTTDDDYLVQLRQTLEDRFNEGELRTFCFDLRIVDYDNLPGTGKADKARELVAYCKRHDELTALVTTGKQLRPDIPWRDPPASGVVDSGEVALPSGGASVRNPFWHRGPIRDPAFFTGRSSEVRIALSLLPNAQSISLVGPRHIGKTSLLYYISNPTILEASGIDPKQFVFVFGGRSCEQLSEHSRSQFLQLMLDEARAGVNQAGFLVDTDASPTSVATFFDFSKALERLTKFGGMLVFLFDEFEYLAQNKNLDPAFFAGLRSIASNLRVAYVTSSARSLLDLTYADKSVLGSPFFNIFSTIRIGLFEDSAARELIRKPSSAAGVAFSDATVEHILSLADHHPFFIQIACFHAFEMQSQNGVLTEADYPSLRERVENELQNHLQYAWDHLGEEAQQVLLSSETAWEDPKLRRVLEFLNDQGVTCQSGSRFRWCSLWANFVKSLAPKSEVSAPAGETMPPRVLKDTSPLPDGLPFKLQITRLTGASFEVRALETPMMGEPHATSRLPYEGAELATVQEILESRSRDLNLTPGQIEALTRLGLWSNSRLASNWLERIGQELYKALFPNDVRGAVTFAFNQAKSERKRIFSQLRFDEDAVDLACYPWELVHDGRRYLCSGGAMEMVRYVTYPEAVMPLRATPPWRLLYIAPRPRDLSALSAEGERLAVWNGLQSLVATGKLTLEQLTAPTYDAFLERMDAADYHILHFDGHGVFARRCPQCRTLNPTPVAVCRNCRSSLDEVQALGYLAFEDDSGDADFVSTVEMENLLFVKDVRLAFLSACQTAVVGGGSLFGGLGPGLIRAGVPAVVAMQFSVPVDAAITFAQSFYKALAQGETVARAVAEGRRRLFRDDTWYIPALYLRSQDDEGTLFGA